MAQKIKNILSMISLLYANECNYLIIVFSHATSGYSERKTIQREVSVEGCLDWFVVNF